MILLWEQYGDKSFTVWDMTNGNVQTPEGETLKGACRGYVAVYTEGGRWRADTRNGDVKNHEGNHKYFDTLEEGMTWVAEQARSHA
jgi:hypothetical protein